jgi:tyrosyl-tRNA synthetase
VKTLNIIDELSWRGLIYQQTNPAAFKTKVETEKITIYVGFDPTADSLHIGHLVPYLALQRFLQYGHNVIVLVGGGTGQIGDPSGRSAERNLLSAEQIAHNVAAVKAQVQQLLQTDDIIFVDNNEWLAQLSLVDFLRDYAKHMNVNTMLSRESVQGRLEDGISLTEFAYQALQAIDFYELNQRYNCTVQAGGSDQWGNIVSGIDLIRKLTDGNVEAFGLTFPLVKKADGTKFGKTASGAVWLSAEKTSPYDFYQFWINTSDADVINYLKIFTFLNAEEIQAYEQAVLTAPHERQAQKYLAASVTELVHGKDALDRALKITDALFTGKIAELSAAELTDALKDGTTFTFSGQGKILDVLSELGIISSKRQGREFLQNGALHINGERVTDEDFVVSRAHAIDGQLSVVRRGKKSYSIIKHVD